MLFIWKEVLLAYSIRFFPLFNYLYQYRLRNISFILRVVIQYLSYSVSESDFRALPNSHSSLELVISLKNLLSFVYSIVFTLFTTPNASSRFAQLLLDAIAPNPLTDLSQQVPRSVCLRNHNAGTTQDHSDVWLSAWGLEIKSGPWTFKASTFPEALPTLPDHRNNFSNFQDLKNRN